MTRHIAVFALAVCFGSIVLAESSSPPTLADKTFLTIPGEQWKLLWNDEFNGNQLDTAKWTSGLSWRGDDGSSRHHNAQYASYITDDDIQFADGNLELLTRKAAVTNPRGKTYNYTQAFIQTDGKFSYTYGYCEVHVKVPTEDGPGLWPAFWMLSHGWPPEDDVAEFGTGRPLPHTHQGFAYRDQNGRVRWDSNHKDSILEGFHTFGMEWGPGYQLFNRDGVITNTSYGSKVPAVPMYLILNSGVTSKPAPTANTVFPNAFLVDYVRVYSRPELPAMLNMGFESDSLAPWSGPNGGKIASTNVHSGRNSLQLSASPSSSEQTLFGLKPATAYRLSGWADSGGNGEVRIGVKNFGGTESYASTTSSGYKQLSVDFTTGADDKTAVIYCSKQAGTGSAYFDDIDISSI